jgi:hypothetical protein
MHADHDDLTGIRVRLRALPGFVPPPGAWAGAQARVAERASGRMASPTQLAMAASLLVMLAAAALLVRLPQGTAPADRAVPAAPPIDGLVAENARLEAVLAGLPHSHTTRVGSAYAVAAIEDRLALLDDTITTVSLEPHAPETAEDLWRERVTLMNSLVQVRYANYVASR